MQQRGRLVASKKNFYLRFKRTSRTFGRVLWQLPFLFECTRMMLFLNTVFETITVQADVGRLKSKPHLFEWDLLQVRISTCRHGFAIEQSPHPLVMKMNRVTKIDETHYETNVIFHNE